MLNALYPSIIIISFFVMFFGFRYFKGTISSLRYFNWIIFCIYITGMVVLTFFPIPYQKFLIQTMIEDNLGLKHNFIPFKGVLELLAPEYLSIGLRQFVGNILLFVPLGFGVSILFFKLKPKAIIVIGFFVSLSIEILQAILGFIIGYNYRAFDVNDLILNTVGTIIGLIIFKALFKFLNNNNLILDKEQKVTV